MSEVKILNEDLSSGKLKPVYLLCGTESYLKRSYKQRFLELFSGGGGMNCAVFQGKDTGEETLIDAADTLPFFAERRLVVAEESGRFKAASAKLPDYIAGMPETTVLLFIESEVDKRNRLYKAVEKRGYVCELNRPDEKALADWAARYLARAGKKITSATMERFLSLTGSDMENVKNELEKLISYLGEEEVADARAVEAVASATVSNRIFDLVSAITSRRVGEAMRLYEDLLALREAPLRILFLIARQYNQLLHVRELTASGKSRAEIAKLLKLPGFAVSKMAAQTRGVPAAALSGMVRRCVELEEMVKTGELQDRLAVELLLCGAE